ncbi:MAG: hypothetical protein PVJ11_14675, partial [Syntrophobacterales bacterium]
EYESFSKDGTHKNPLLYLAYLMIRTPSSPQAPSVRMDQSIRYDNNFAGYLETTKEKNPEGTHLVPLLLPLKGFKKNLLHCALSVNWSGAAERAAHTLSR